MSLMKHLAVLAVLLVLPASISASKNTPSLRQAHNGAERPDPSRYSLFGYRNQDRTHLRDRIRDRVRDKNAAKHEKEVFKARLRRFRTNRQNILSKNTQQTMGDPSTLRGLAKSISPNCNMTLLEDTPYLQRFMSRWPMTTGLDLEDFLYEEMTFRDAAADLPTPSSESQRVYLDFNNGVNYTAIVNGVFFELPAHVYTLEEQYEILERFKADYAEFNVEFTIDADMTSVESPDEMDEKIMNGGVPLEGEYSSVLFNQDVFPIEIEVQGGSIVGLSVLFGLAEGIDFLNVNRNDTALVNNNFWELLAFIDPSGELLSSTIGVPINGPADVQKVVSQATVAQSANTGAHELGHNMGLRHHDSIGAPGNGLPLFVPPDGAFVPTWTGQRNATETLIHLLASGASVGLPLEARAVTDPFFSERSTIKLVFAEGKGEIISETEAKSGIIELPELDIPNTILTGENAGTDTIPANALLITGFIEEFPEEDSYRVFLEEGTFLTAEVISTSVPIFDAVVTRLTILKEDTSGSLTEVFNNSQVFEPFDPMMIDVPITETGNYVVQVTARQEIFADTDGDQEYDTNLTLPLNSTFLMGDYWLLLYSLDHEITSPRERNEAPVPTSLTTPSPTIPPTMNPTVSPTMPPTDTSTAAPTDQATRTKKSSTPAPITLPPTPFPTTQVTRTKRTASTPAPTAFPTAKATRTKRTASTPAPTTLPPTTPATTTLPPTTSAPTTLPPTTSTPTTTGPSPSPTPDDMVQDAVIITDVDLISDRQSNHHKPVPKPPSDHHHGKRTNNDPDSLLAWLPSKQRKSHP